MAPSTLYLQIQEVLKVSKKCNSAHNYQMQCNNYQKKERNFESLSRKKRFVSPVFHGVVHQVRPCLNFAGYNVTNQSKWTRRQVSFVSSPIHHRFKHCMEEVKIKVWRIVLFFLFNVTDTLNQGSFLKEFTELIPNQGFFWIKFAWRPEIPAI